MKIAVVAPVSGRVIALSAVPDPVFSAAMVGPGIAVDPGEAESVVAVAPVSGQVVKLHPHAFVVKTEDGAGVLTHLGIDTVQLDGDGFELHVEEGSGVAAGEPVVTWSPAAVAAGGRSPVVPVVALDSAADALSDLREAGDVAAGEPLFTWSR